MMLSQEDFRKAIEIMPLVSFDLLVLDKNKKILLGKRKNNPAKDYWFVPGGSIKKNETFEEAFKRITKNELGYEESLKNCKFHGIYRHIYEDNFFDSKTGTDYITIAVKFISSHEISNSFEEQHSEKIWLSESEILSHPKIHQNTKNYFLKNPENKLDLSSS